MLDASFIVRVDPAEPAFATLIGFGKRLEALLCMPKAQADHDVAATLDDFLGAIYALILAKLQGFVDRPVGQNPEFDKVQKRAAQIAVGEVRLDGRWMAGFHFNSALLRCAAVYHRILRILTGRHERNVWIKDLLPNVEPAYRVWTGLAWSHTNIDLVHVEVNTLKHDSGGVNKGRQATYGNAISAVEELLNLLEAWPDLK